MKVPFRQGIVRIQTDIANNPTFLQLTPSGVTLNVSPDPTIFTIAHGSVDYLFQEGTSIVNAWGGPFLPNVNYWLYWDINLVTGIRTFGSTIVQPVVGANEPIAAAEGLHWYNTQTFRMSVRQSGRWVEVLRLFAGKLQNGAVLVPYLPGTQIGINTPCYAGFILYDDVSAPVKKYDMFNRGQFITTETPLASQFSQLANYKLESAITSGQALEYIPAWYCIAYIAPQQIGLASNTTPNFPCIGLATEDMYTGEVRSFITSGYASNVNWNWTQPTETPLFVGATGEITAVVPQLYSIQRIGYIIDSKTILVNIHQTIFLSSI